MKELNACILKLEITIEKIIPLLSKEYSLKIEGLENNDGPTEDKNLIFKWNTVATTGNTFEEKNKVIGDTSLKYIEALAQIENLSLTKKQIELIKHTGKLSKDMLVKPKESYVMFIEYLGATYCIMCGPQALEGKIRSTLMEKKLRSESAWGTIYHENLKEYTFGKSFYYWLLDNKGKELDIDNKKLIIKDVRGFKSNTDKKTYSFSGEGNNIDKKMPLKSIVGMDERLVSLYLNIEYKKNNYSLYLDYDGRIRIFIQECYEIGCENIKYLTQQDILLDIYFDIIPFLIKKFNEASIRWGSSELAFRKQTSIEGILELMNQNSLELKDLERAMEKINKEKDE